MPVAMKARSPPCSSVVALNPVAAGEDGRQPGRRKGARTAGRIEAGHRPAHQLVAMVLRQHGHGGVHEAQAAVRADRTAGERIARNVARLVIGAAPGDRFDGGAEHRAHVRSAGRGGARRGYHDVRDQTALFEQAADQDHALQRADPYGVGTLGDRGDVVDVHARVAGRMRAAKRVALQPVDVLHLRQLQRAVGTEVEVPVGETGQRLQPGAERILRAAQQRRAIGGQRRRVDGGHEDVAGGDRRVGSHRERPLGERSQQAAALERVQDLAAVGRRQGRRVERQSVLTAVRLDDHLLDGAPCPAIDRGDGAGNRRGEQKVLMLLVVEQRGSHLDPIPGLHVGTGRPCRESRVA